MWELSISSFNKVSALIQEENGNGKIEKEYIFWGQFKIVLDTLENIFVSAHQAA